MPPMTTNSATGRCFRTRLAEQQQRRARRGRARATSDWCSPRPREEVAHAIPEVAAMAAAEAEQLGQLRAGQKQRDAALEADEHGFREEVDDGAGAAARRRRRPAPRPEAPCTRRARHGAPGRRPRSLPSDAPISSEIADVTVSAVWRELQNSQKTSPPNRHA